MTDVLNGVMDQLGHKGIGQIAASLGVDSDQASSMVASAVPAIVAGLANNTRKSEGAQALAGALDNHDDSIFGQLGDLLGGGGDGAAILGHVFGNKRGGVESNLAQQTGLDLGIIAKLLPILAPLVMGYLAKQKKSKGLNPGSLGDLLGGERRSTEKSNPGLGGLAALLDADGDGSVIDDVLGKLTGN